jgi:glucose/arabinose dehydrogenase
MNYRQAFAAILVLVLGLIVAGCGPSLDQQETTPEEVGLAETTVSQSSDTGQPSPAGTAVATSTPLEPEAEVSVTEGAVATTRTAGETPVPTAEPLPTVAMEVLQEIVPEQPLEGSEVDVIASGLEKPVAFAFAPDGRLFFTEKESGRLRVIVDGVLLPAPVLTLPVAVLGEQGLIGVAIDPEFEQNHAIWVSYTLRESENNGLKANQIARFVEQNNVATDVATVLTLPNETESDRHNIGNIAFGSDGMLYVAVGDDSMSATAQMLGDPRGKILRFDPTSPLTAPEDNPFYDGEGPNYDPIYAYGLRNSFDFAFDPLIDGNRIIATENGPDCDDELNLILPGHNYGWAPDHICSEEQLRDPAINTIDPLLYWAPTTAPAGITVYTGDDFPEWYGDVFFCSFQDGLLHHLKLNPTRDGFVSHSSINGMFCQVDVFNGPDGGLYFLEGGGITIGTLKRLYRPG